MSREREYYSAGMHYKTSVGKYNCRIHYLTCLSYIHMLSVDVTGHLCFVSVTDNYNIARALTKSFSLGDAAGISLRRIITELFGPFEQILWLDMN